MQAALEKLRTPHFIDGFQRRKYNFQPLQCNILRLNGGFCPNREPAPPTVQWVWYVRRLRQHWTTWHAIFSENPECVLETARPALIMRLASAGIKGIGALA